MIRVLARGNWQDDSGEEVSPAVPAFLQAAPLAADRRQTRVDLADWFVRRDNPLVARVMVSTPEPVATGRMKRMGLSDWACAGAGKSAPMARLPIPSNALRRDEVIAREELVMASASILLEV